MIIEVPESKTRKVKKMNAVRFVETRDTICIGLRVYSEQQRRKILYVLNEYINEPRHVISNNVALLISVDSDEPMQSPFKFRNSKWFSVSSLGVIEYSSDKQRLRSDCAHAQGDLRLC